MVKLFQQVKFYFRAWLVKIASNSSQAWYWPAPGHYSSARMETISLSR